MIVIYKDLGRWYWTFETKDSQATCISKGYLTRWTAKRGAQRFQRQILSALIANE